MKNFKFNQNKEVRFPEEASLIIRSLVQKYRLETLEELIKEFGPARRALTLKEQEELREKLLNLPGRQIAKTVKEVSQGKIKNEMVFIDTLQKRLNISEKIAKELTKDLGEKVLSLVQITLKEEKEVSPYKGAKETISPEKPVPQKRKDIYREPIE